MKNKPDLFTSISLILIVLVVGGIIAGLVWQWWGRREAYEPLVVTESTPNPNAPYNTVILDTDLPPPTGFGNDGWHNIEVTIPPGTWGLANLFGRFIFDDGTIKPYYDPAAILLSFILFADDELARLIESGEIPADTTHLVFPQHSTVFDLSPLATLVYLETLYLPANMRHVDVSPLAGLANLQIFIQQNFVADALGVPPYFARLPEREYPQMVLLEQQEPVRLGHFNDMLNWSQMFVGEVDGWRFYQQYTMGGGSGEFFWDSGSHAWLIARNARYEKNIVGLAIGYAQIHNGRVYFLELNFEPFRSFTVGYGWLSSMNIDGSDMQRLVEDEVQGDFFIIDDTIFFLQADSLVMYTISPDGTNRQKFVDIGEKIPYAHTLAFGIYGNFLMIYCVSTNNSLIVEANGNNPMAISRYMSIINWNDDAVFFRNFIDESYWVYRVR